MSDASCSRSSRAPEKESMPSPPPSDDTKEDALGNILHMFLSIVVPLIPYGMLLDQSAFLVTSNRNWFWVFEALRD